MYSLKFLLDSGTVQTNSPSVYTVQCRSVAVCMYSTVQISGCVYIWYSADQWLCVYMVQCRSVAVCVYSIVQINGGVYIYGTV